MSWLEKVFDFALGWYIERRKRPELIFTGKPSASMVDDWVRDRAHFTIFNHGDSSALDITPHYDWSMIGGHEVSTSILAPKAHATVTLYPRHGKFHSVAEIPFKVLYRDARGRQYELTHPPE